MGYRIEQEGFEFQGVRLGQKCLLDDEEVTVIGFDEDEGITERFIVVKAQGCNGDMIISQSRVVTVILNKYEDCYYDWVSLHEIEFINLIVDELNPPKQISPIHVADILEDAADNWIKDESNCADSYNIINRCIEALRENIK